MNKMLKKSLCIIAVFMIFGMLAIQAFVTNRHPVTDIHYGQMNCLDGYANPRISLPRELQSQILTEWLKWAYGESPVYNGTNARIALYLGAYDDSVVVVIDDIFRGVRPARPTNVAGLTFEYGNRIMVWQNGQFGHLVWEAFEEGWVSADDMQTIHALTLTTELPRAMLLEDLPLETEERLKADFRELNFLSDDDFVWVKNYLGTYNGKVAVVMDGPFFYLTATTQETIAGLTFHYAHSGPLIMIWYDGEFHGLQQAYDLTLVTQGDLRAIQQRWNPRFG